MWWWSGSKKEAPLSEPASSGSLQLQLQPNLPSLVTLSPVTHSSLQHHMLHPWLGQTLALQPVNTPKVWNDWLMTRVRALESTFIAFHVGKGFHDRWECTWWSIKKKSICQGRSGQRLSEIQYHNLHFRLCQLSQWISSVWLLGFSLFIPCVHYNPPFLTFQSICSKLIVSWETK